MDDSSRNTTTIDTVSWKFFGLISLVVVILWCLTIVVIPNVYPETERQGQFGDMFGSVNALFAGLAFAGVIVAILLQKKELELQRKEIVETRAEIKGQKEQLTAQNITLKKQNFEQSFFQLLGLHNDIVTSIDPDSPGI